MLCLRSTVVGALTLLQSWPRADVTHILFGLQPTFILFGYLLYCAWRAAQRLPGPRPIVAALALPIALAPLLVFLWKGYQRTDWEYQNYIVAVRTDRAQGNLHRRARSATHRYRDPLHHRARGRR